MRRVVALSVHCIVLVQMLAKGKDVSELFPAVVKNVAAKNLEVSPFGNEGHTLLWPISV